MKPKIALFVHQPACSVDSINGVILALSAHYDFKLFSKDQVEKSFFDDVDIVCFPGGVGDADRFEKLYNVRVLLLLESAGGFNECAFWARTS